MKRLMLVVNVLIVATMLLSACATPTPEVIKEIVTQVVTQVVEVEKEVTKIVAGTSVVEKVVETKIVEKEVTKVVEVEKEVTKIVEKEVVKEVTKIVEVEVPVPGKPGWVQGPMTSAPMMPAPLPGEMAEEQVYRYADTRASDPSHWDPLRNPGGLTRSFLRNLFLPLLRVDQDWNLFPGLAVAWEYTKDFTTYIFHLDPRAVWSDGTPIVAQDIVNTWNWAVGPDTLVSGAIRQDICGRIKGYEDVFAGAATEMEGLKALDDLTLQIELIEPDPVYKFKITWWCGGIPHVDDIKKDEELWTSFEGNRFSGPFMLTDFDAATGEISMVPNPNYWRKKPYLERLEFIVIEDVNTQMIMIENKELEFGSMPAEAWPDWEASGLIKPLKRAVYPYLYYFWFRMDIPPLDDINVRKALIHAIDYDKAFDASMDPVHFEAPTLAWVPLGLPCTRNDVGLPGREFNPELAREEIAKSKYGSVEDIPLIRMQSGSSAVDWAAPRMAEVLLEMWKTNLGLTNIEYKLNTSLFPEDEQEMIHINRQSSGVLTPDPATWMLSSFSATSGYCENWNYCNPELQQVVQEAFMAPRDAPEYCELVQKAEDILWDDYTFIGIMSNGMNPQSRTVSWVNNRIMTIDQDFYTLEHYWISKH